MRWSDLFGLGLIGFGFGSGLVGCLVKVKSSYRLGRLALRSQGQFEGFLVSRRALVLGIENVLGN